MAVHVINRQRAVRVSVRGLGRLLEEMLSEELGGEGQVNVLLTDDREITRMNRQFLGEEGPTDVLSFGSEEDEKEGVLGDVAVSGETAAREASARGLSPEEELTRYAVHGLLHLLGYDDQKEADRRRMWRRQEEIVKRQRGSGRGQARVKESRG